MAACILPRPSSPTGLVGKVRACWVTGDVRTLAIDITPASEIGCLLM
jgi:hypothetical protein